MFQCPPCAAFLTFLSRIFVFFSISKVFVYVSRYVSLTDIGSLVGVGVCGKLRKL